MANSRLARLFDLVPFIVKHQGIPIAELAEKFQISVEQLEKDLWLLYMCGLPGQTPLELMEFEFEDGYVSVRNADELKSPRSLTQIELASLVIGLEILISQGISGAEQLKNKLASKLSTEISYQPAKSDLYLPEISQAIQQNKVLSIIYNGKAREVIPFETYTEDRTSYLRAFCKSAEDRRTFKISKIESLKITDNQELAPNLVPSNETPKTTKIATHKEKRLVREALGNSEQIDYFSVEWLISETMALAGAVELEDPQLRAQILARVKASQSLYLE
ncbi:MAG: WYL domain-containing protein [Candidatus Nanopelagicaceae bacterium]|nr:WYL domain-containing protein [Candidatus Nanopelagicaceae bacterium]